MVNFQEKKLWRKIIYSKVSIFILLIILIFAINSVLNIYGKYKKSRDSVDIARTELDKLRNRQNTLTDKINFLKQESGVEAEIRDKFAVTKDGEKVIVIVEDKNTFATTTAKGKTWWQEFLDLWKE